MFSCILGRNTTVNKNGVPSPLLNFKFRELIIPTLSTLQWWQKYSRSELKGDGSRNGRDF